MRFDSPEADLLFTALGNKTRRRMLQRLAEKPVRSISELAREFKISNTAASNQIKILEKANLVSRTERGKYHQIAVSHATGNKADDLFRVFIIGQNVLSCLLINRVVTDGNLECGF